METPTSTEPAAEPPKRARKPRVLSITEIMESLSAIATEGEGAARTQALRLLLGANAGTVALSEPLTAEQIEERMVRLMKACGPSMVARYYRRAFPQANAMVPRTDRVKVEDLALPSNFKFPKTVGEFYKMFPEIKGHGVPKGYPMGKGPVLQREWLKEMTLKTFQGKKQIEVDRAAKEAAEMVNSLSSGGADDASEREGDQVLQRPPAHEQQAGEGV